LVSDSWPDYLIPWGRERKLWRLRSDLEATEKRNSSAPAERQCSHNVPTLLTFQYLNVPTAAEEARGHDT
jgi:hypothetical protein